QGPRHAQAARQYTVQDIVVVSLPDVRAALLVQEPIVKVTAELTPGTDVPVVPRLREAGVRKTRRRPRPGAVFIVPLVIVQAHRVRVSQVARLVRLVLYKILRIDRLQPALGGIRVARMLDTVLARTLRKQATVATVP